MPAVSYLTAKQARFVQEYLIDGNGAGAAVRAGYSVRSAKAIACELLTKPDLQAAIREKQALVSDGLEITRTGVMRGFLDAYEIAKADRNPASMVSAMANLAKVLGYFAPETKRVEIGAPGQGAMTRMESMSDAELLAIIEAGSAN